MHWQVYGSDLDRAYALRGWIDGKMVMESTSVGPMLPRNTAGFANANDAHAYPDDQLFFAGGRNLVGPSPQGGSVPEFDVGMLLE